jgi:hypothetical protein
LGRGKDGREYDLEARLWDIAIWREMKTVAGKGKQRKCRICKKRPPWKYKNCPPGVCKQCYHRDVWVDRPAARKQPGAVAGQQEFRDPAPDLELWIMRDMLGDSWDDDSWPVAEVDGEQDSGISDCPF